jgi:dTDP-4-dehydrorhamnose reductase
MGTHNSPGSGTDENHWLFYKAEKRRKPMKVLVTGADGQLGMTLRKLATLRGDQDFLFTDLDDLDITDYHAAGAFISRYGPEVIINCASYNAVDQAEDDPDTAMKINGEAVGKLAGIARRSNCGLIHISSDYVFDGKKTSPYTEKDKPNPLSAYAFSKFAGEKAVMEADPRAAIIRTSWLYSEYARNFVKTIREIGAERDEIRVVNDQTGTPTYAGDLAEAIIILIPKLVHFTGSRIFNYSNEGETNWAGFAEYILDYSGIPCRVIPVSTREYGLSKAERPAFSVMDKSLVRKEFGLNIPDWRSSLEKCIDNLNKIENKHE